ncbi:MAG: hypothetical protein H7210_02825, partial [Pyrinomonadaceae bacterium]|nr:hypothetical protein [Phycisphaerales bacterium]
MSSIWKRRGAKPGSKWMVTYTVRLGICKTVTGMTDYKLSEQLAAKLEH